MGHAGTDTDKAACWVPTGRLAAVRASPNVTLEAIFPNDGLVVMANLQQEITNSLIESDRADNEESEQSQRDLNPCRHLERVVS